MRTILLVVFLVALPALRGDTSPHPRLLQDPKTKIVYYMESDWRHMAAISPSGKLLWCKSVVPAGARDFSFTLNGDTIRLSFFLGGCADVQLDKNTGASTSVIVD